MTWPVALGLIKTNINVGNSTLLVKLSRSTGRDFPINQFILFPGNLYVVVRCNKLIMKIYKHAQHNLVVTPYYSWNIIEIFYLFGERVGHFSSWKKRYLTPLKDELKYCDIFCYLLSYIAFVWSIYTSLLNQMYLSNLKEYKSIIHFYIINSYVTCMCFVMSHATFGWFVDYMQLLDPF